MTEESRSNDVCSHIVVLILYVIFKSHNYIPICYMQYIGIYI